MLEPENRLLLLDALRPPAGYQFDRAVGTTFTLDLIAMLVTPVAFALFDVESPDGRVAANPIAVIESVRRFSDRISVFTQAGQIRVPPAFRTAYAFLERSVVPVKAPRAGGIFHPKVWVIRFIAPDGDVRLRFLCLSRNLTFDRSWDTILRLDGKPTGAPTKVSAPIGEFLRALPAMAIEPLAPERQAPIDELAHQVATAEWEGLPDRMTVERMLPIGHDGKAAWPFPKESWRRLVVSPFAEEGFLGRFFKPGRNDILVSRPETLDALGGSGLAATGRTFVLRDDAVGEDELSPGEERSEASEGVDAMPAPADLRGLHAKLFIVDQPYWSSIFTGSANATGAAFGANVEFLVELKGRNMTHGTEALVATPDGKAVGFGRLLQLYPVPDAPASTPEDVEAARALEGIAMSIGSMRFTAEVGPGEGDMYPLRLAAHGDMHPMRPRAGETLELAVRPLSRGAGWAVSPAIQADGFAAQWQLSFDSLTAFFAIDLVARKGATVSRASFVVRAVLVGEPRDRMQRLLAAELHSKSDLMRLLLMLLGRGDPAFGELVDLLTNEQQPGQGEGAWIIGSESLLEPLMHTLARNPSRLDEIARLVHELERTEEGRRLLPDSWFDIWAAVEAARPAQGAAR